MPTKRLMNYMILAIAVIAIFSAGCSERNPDEALVWNEKGEFLEKEEKHYEAIQAFDKAIELDPQLLEARYNKADALIALFKYEEAIQTYDEIIELNPQDVDAWSYKGYLLAINLKKYDEAIQAFDKVMEFDSQASSGPGSMYRQAVDGKVKCLVLQGKYDEALQTADKATEEDSQYKKYYWGLKGFTYHEMGNDKESQEWYDKANEL